MLFFERRLTIFAMTSLRKYNQLNHYGLSTSHAVAFKVIYRDREA